MLDQYSIGYAQTISVDNSWTQRDRINMWPIYNKAQRPSSATAVAHRWMPLASPLVDDHADYAGMG